MSESIEARLVLAVEQAQSKARDAIHAFGASYRGKYADDQPRFKAALDALALYGDLRHAQGHWEEHIAICRVHFEECERRAELLAEIEVLIGGGATMEETMRDRNKT